MEPEAGVDDILKDESLFVTDASVYLQVPPAEVG
jgi:hypothetical protein